VSERQWGTCREDYAGHGNSWIYLPFEAAHYVAYRWGEDGLAGWCDRAQNLCLGLALWNGKDPILKERLFGLNNPQGNHGEDVKELYYYLDATPTHSYMKMLYKYPQAEYPYDELRTVNFERKADPSLGEYELLDTGIFDDNRYFDVFVEFAQGGVDDTLVQVTAHNRGDQDSELCILPQAWFRNTWSWAAEGSPEAKKPEMRHSPSNQRIDIKHHALGEFYLHLDGQVEVIFCENMTHDAVVKGGALSPYKETDPALEKKEEVDIEKETECADLVSEAPQGEEPPKPAQTGAEAGFPHHTSGCESGQFKDGFNDYVVGGKKVAVSAFAGTKAGLLTRHVVPAGGQVTVRYRLSSTAHSFSAGPFADFDEVFEKRIAEADKFYSVLQTGVVGAERQQIQRQALAGMIWTKQFYYYNIHKWVQGDPGRPKPESRGGRNEDWDHLCNADIISMPDKWEYPWYAAWDLAFHCLPLALVDAHFAKGQLALMTKEWYMHPNGQIPAYEWNFSDVNPPVHAWAVWRVFQMDRKARGDDGDLGFLEELFHKLMLNFTWWVNRKDAEGRNIFQGGFLGLDNIGVVDRSAPLANGGLINQSDGTSWMAFYSLTLMRIALELALHNSVYESIACKFFEHFLQIAKAMSHDLWDPEDEFYYDALANPDGKVPIKLRSIVGLIPLFAVEVLEPEMLDRLPRFRDRTQEILETRPDLADLVSRFTQPGHGERRLLSLLRGHRMKALLKRMLDPNEFLSDHGIRGLSKHHEEHPYSFGDNDPLKYDPGEATVIMMGGNSNWRGPVWFPINYLLIESLQKFHQYYGDEYLIEYPTGSGEKMPILEIADSLSDRLIGIFEKSPKDGVRPGMRLHPKMQEPHFEEHLLFHEYFHGDSGRGVGASHQTGSSAAG
ncbi:unnamed protein product, partial [Polarella glacialis]